MPNNFAALRKSFLQLTKSWNEDGRIGVGMSLIIPRLYIGSFSDAQDEEQLCKNEIVGIISVANICQRQPSYINHFLKISISDSPDVNISDYFNETNRFIHKIRQERRGAVLVNCIAGVSRSVSIVTAYLLTIPNVEYAQALSHISRRRPIASPNFGFRMQLMRCGNNKDYASTSARIRIETSSSLINYLRQEVEDCVVLFGHLSVNDDMISSLATNYEKLFVDRNNRCESEIVPNLLELLPDLTRSHGDVAQNESFQTYNTSIQDSCDSQSDQIFKHLPQSSENLSQDDKLNEDEVSEKTKCNTVDHISENDLIEHLDNIDFIDR
ncbi:unnamed protein product [Dracunculus medinensis]|uniref:Tyrosine-protein phosphatase domain-containing protein n=1 Tax=Dracunculus medinensis TaxID=318479 RepID=A0A158Q540_DRAME|nr:unnamed protein product [Dracunculus medinensis]